MAVNYRHPGKRLLYANSGTTSIRSGSIVAAGALVGVALNDILPGDAGPAEVEGVWELPCVLSAAVSQWATVYYDPASGKIVDDEPAADGFVAGVAVLGAAADATTMEVKINV